LTEFKGSIFFAANDSANGDELWVLDDVVPISSTRKLNKSQINIYPNPANTIINIITNEKLSSVTILNQTGQTILKEQKNTIDIAHLPSGIYFIQVHLASGQTTTSRLIKE